MATICFDRIVVTFSGISVNVGAVMVVPMVVPWDAWPEEMKSAAGESWQ